MTRSAFMCNDQRWNVGWLTTNPKYIKKKKKKKRTFGVCVYMLQCCYSVTELNATETSWALCVSIFVCVALNWLTSRVGNKHNCDANTHLRDAHNIDIE